MAKRLLNFSRMAALVPVLVMGGFVSQQAQAATVEFEVVSFLSPENNVFRDAFTVSEDGAYQATLTDFGFPAAFDVLIMSVSTATEAKVQLLGPGSDVFDAVSGTTYFVNVAGVPSTTGPFAGLDLGQFGAAVTAVPVPPAVWLLGSALLGLLTVRRNSLKA